MVRARGRGLFASAGARWGTWPQRRLHPRRMPFVVRAEIACLQLGLLPGHVGGSINSSPQTFLPER